MRIKTKDDRRERIKYRIRKRVQGNEARPFRRAAKPLALAQPNALNPVFFRSNLHR